MKLFFKHIVLYALVVLCGIPAYSADLISPKREMRNVWIVTAWRIDWPPNIITGTGNAVQINSQKQSMIALLDSLAKNNMNCVNFQVRSFGDAMYKSAYEPWSSDLVVTRGMDPGYDPLQFVIDECHKRGMECHAWVNPYRYETESRKWKNEKGEYRHDHPDWLYEFDGRSILNPGKPEVIQRVVDICKDIITKYDVDGILYDDYFYINDSTKKVESYVIDKDLFDEYRKAGGKLSQGDWRRENVNTMIKAVYDMIQEVKPWVRFGVSPAGVAASKEAVASKYGVTPCPGSDWQYETIWSDPLAWVSRRTLDYISPQVYRTIKYDKGNYAEIALWWSMVADKFKRHLFISHSITSLTGGSKATKGLNGGDILMNTEGRIYIPKANGPNNDTFNEYADQVRLNREYSLDDSPGSFFYSAKYMSWVAPLFSHYLKTTVFSKPAILPAITYKPGYNPGKVKNLNLSGGKLSWDGYDDVRYTVYAVPTTVAQKDFNFEVDYLLGTSYETTYNIPDVYGSGYNFAVCVLDRMGNEYTPVFFGADVKKLPAPLLISPADGSSVDDPFDLEWSAVNGASGYIVEIAYDAEFKDMFRTYQVNGTKFSTAGIEGLKSDIKLYWRVRSSGVNCEDGVSVSSVAIPKILSVLSPENNSKASVTPIIEWNSYKGNNSQIEISTNPHFMDGYTVHTAESTSSTYKVPDYVLKSSTQYYARVTVTNAGESKTSEGVCFTTEFIEACIPEIRYPKDGGKLYSDDKITLTLQPGVHRFIVEVASNESFPSRNKYVENVNAFGYESAKGGDIKISGKNLVDGNTYYLRAETVGMNEKGVITKSGTSEVISFVYGGQGSGVEDNISGTDVRIKGITEPVLSITAPVSARIEVKVFNTVGIQEDVLYSGTADGLTDIPLGHLSKGLHLIIVSINGTVRTLKMIR